MIRIFHAKTHLKTVKKAAQAALLALDVKEKDVYIELSLVDEAKIKKLNNNARQIDEVTDVLSFQNIADIKLPLNVKSYPSEYSGEGLVLGEIFICLKRAEGQAEEYGHSIERELAFLTVHGVLHLLGLDHVTEEGHEKMTDLTERILKSAGFEPSCGEIAPVPRPASSAFKSGFVAVMGRPNAGKSTLINALVGEKVSIVSWKPQTTRDKIKGIYNDAESQIIFIDTPGLHTPKNSLGKYMMKSAASATEGTDCVLYIIDGEKGMSEQDKENIDGYLREKLRVIAVVNKTDHITKERVFEILSKLNGIKNLSAVVPVSALKNKNTQPLILEIKKLLTDTVKYFDDDAYTDKSMRFMAAEIIREKALRLLDKEVPYGVGVDLTEYKLREGGGLLDISADLVCEKEAHKPIILGSGGAMIKKIATYSRQDIEAVTGTKVFLTLFVKVKSDWRDSPIILRDLGYE
jgi:GTP-binding protein Era